MAGLSSPGITSGLDVNSLVSQLVAAERAPAQNRLTKAGKKADTTISALGSLRGALATLQTSIDGIKTAAALQARKATSADNTVVTAAATSSAAPGSYSVEVLALASAHKLVSAPYAGGSTATVGDGNLTISVAGNAFTVAIAAGHGTLAEIRDAINAATDNSGVQATVITASDGARLALQSTKTGVAYAVRVTTSGGNGGLASLVYDPGTSTQLTQQTAAADASAKIDGFSVTSSTNSIDAAIDGVSLSLASAKPGTTVAVTVSNDTAATTDKINKFVTDFNSAVKTMSTLGRYDAATKTGGPLLGDAMLRGIESSLRREATAKVSGASAPYDSLNAIGITLKVDGTLQVDAAKLSTALNANFTAIAGLFAGTSGVATRLASLLDTSLRSDSALTTRSNGLQAQKKSLQTDQDALDARMAAVEARYRTQFTALDQMLATMQQTSDYLTKQLG